METMLFGQSERSWPDEFQMLCEQYVPRVVPGSWTPLDRPGWWLRRDGLKIAFSANRERDGKVWLHASMSRRSRLPDYEDMVAVRNVLFGPERKAIQILAPDSEHVNIHPYCLHLWSCVDGDGLPDFRHGGQI